jgi:hypothetical protein
MSCASWRVTWAAWCSVPDLSRSERFGDIWRSLHEGGLTIETPVGESPDARIALRTVIQLDGDRMVLVDFGAMSALSHYQRLRLAARHRQAVRARSMGVFVELHRGISIFRGVLLAGFGLGEVASVAARVSSGQFGWRTLLWDQAYCLTPLALHRALPYGIRWLHSAAARLLRVERRVVSSDIIRRLRRGERTLPAPDAAG